MVAQVNLSVLAQHYCPTEGQIPKPGMVEEERGTEKMRREVGSKPPNHVMPFFSNQTPSEIHIPTPLPSTQGTLQWM